MLRCCPTAYQIALHFWSYMSIAVHALHCSQIVLHLLRCIKITKLSPRQQTRYNTCDHARAKCAVLIVGYIKCSALGTHSTRCYVKNRAHFRGSPLMPIYDWDLRLETPYVQECQVIVISYQVLSEQQRVLSAGRGKLFAPFAPCLAWRPCQRRITGSLTL